MKSVSRLTWTFLILFAFYSFLHHRASIWDHFPSARDTRELSLVKFVCGNVSHFLFVLKVLVGPFSWNIFPIFSYLLSEHWVSNLLSSVFLYFFWEITCYCNCHFSKLVYHLSLADFKIFFYVLGVWNSTLMHLAVFLFLNLALDSMVYLSQCSSKRV